MCVTLWLDAPRPWVELAGLAGLAERSGWDGIRVGDGPGLECWAVLGALAATVPRVRLESVARDALRRHPAVLAKEACTVDLLSGGRLILGLAPGADSDSEARLAECFQVVKCLAGEVRSSWRGEFYRLEEAPFEPKPRQQPLPLMVVGGSATLAARFADHWTITGSPEDATRSIVALERACDALGRDRSAIKVSALWTTTTVQSDYDSAGIDEWVVKDDQLGRDASAWSFALAQIKLQIDQFEQGTAI